MDSSPHGGRDEDPIEKLRDIGNAVDRAVAEAQRVREEVEPALATIWKQRFPDVPLH
jgi:hypothetical protein